MKATTKAHGNGDADGPARTPLLLLATAAVLLAGCTTTPNGGDGGAGTPQTTMALTQASCTSGTPGTATLTVASTSLGLAPANLSVRDAKDASRIFQATWNSAAKIIVGDTLTVKAPAGGVLNCNATEVRVVNVNSGAEVARVTLSGAPPVRHLSLSQTQCSGTTAKFTLVSVSPDFPVSSLAIKDATAGGTTLTFTATSTNGWLAAGDTLSVTLAPDSCTHTLNFIDKESGAVVASLTLHT